MTQAEHEAIGWMLRLPHAGASDWEAFVRWLEGSTLNRAAYDRVSLVDDDAAIALRKAPPQPVHRSLATPQPVAAPQPLATSQPLAPSMPTPGSPVAHAGSADGGVRRRPGRWIAAAAALAAGLAAVIVLKPGDTSYTVTTRLGEHRVVTMADGSQVALNGGSRIVLDRRTPRRIELAAGEATISVRHDPHAPFEVRVGDSTLRDLGTRFDVRRLDNATEVAVAAGSVLYNPNREALTLAAGDTLRDPDGPAEIERGTTKVAAIGGWRSGQLSFAQAPLGRVAHDITQTSGLPLELSPALADRRFTGTIVVTGDRAALVARMRALLDVAIVRHGGAWRVEPAGSATP